MLTQRERAVLACIDDEQLVRWTQELTRIDSVWRPQLGRGEAEAAAWLAARCRALGLETHVEEVEPGRPNVIALLHGTVTSRERPGRTLMFEGHTDVVTEGDPNAWRDPPFSATLRNGRIYGRGANDMKAGVCCALMAAQAIVESSVDFAGTILLGFVCDEEEGMIGIKHFVERGWADAVDAAIICEPEANQLCIAQKGVVWLRATVCGVMAHGAMPRTGSNSAYPLAHFLTRVQALEAQLIATHGSHALLGQPSITPTIVSSPVRQGGEPQNNVMPGAAEVLLDCRLLPGQDANALAGQVEALLHEAVAHDERLSATLEIVEARSSTHTDREQPVVQTLASAFVDLTGSAPTYAGVPGSTDGTILHARKGIPIVTCGPGDVHIPHHIDEFVDIEQMKLAVRLYAVAALRFLDDQR